MLRVVILMLLFMSNPTWAEKGTKITYCTAYLHEGWWYDIPTGHVPVFLTTAEGGGYRDEGGDWLEERVILLTSRPGNQELDTDDLPLIEFQGGMVSAKILSYRIQEAFCLPLTGSMTS